jgi:hypothetical protein
VPADFQIGSEVVAAALADPQTARIEGDLGAFLSTLDVCWNNGYPNHLPTLFVRHEAPPASPKARLA